MKISEIRQWLEPRGVRLTRAMGQNFLHDPRQLERIVALAELGPGDRVLEIGPGLGALTEPLLAAGVEVLAVEKDSQLAGLLRERVGARPGLTIVEADALDYLRQRTEGWAGWRMVSNLPYSVASPILVELGLMERGPDRLVVTVQWEVGERLKAEPVGGDYGLLSVFVQMNYEPGPSFRIPATCFFPAPEVASACVRLDRRAEPLALPEEKPRVVKLVRLAFSQRRKMMWKLLRGSWPEERLAMAYEAAGLSRDVRAERVSVAQFVTLARVLSRRDAPPAGSSG